VKVHPLSLTRFHQIKDEKTRRTIIELTKNYESKEEFFVDKLSQGVGMIAAAFYPRPVIVRLSDFKTNEYANLIGGAQFEPKEENPMIGFRGASRYYDDRYKDGFALECQTLLRVREEMGLTNIKIMVPFCRTVEEARRVVFEMQKNGLIAGQSGLELYVMCEVPSNVWAIDLFSSVFDGFSIGSNDLTQLVLGLDRDSEIVAELFDERDPAVKRAIAHAIKGAHQAGRTIGICGQAPSDYPEFVRFLIDQQIDSISLNEDAVLKTLLMVAQAETKPEAPEAVPAVSVG
jgi:pyruvate, water dikinase